MVAFLRLVRPKQWTKNLVLFVAVVFAGRALVLQDAWHAVIGFALFCMLSSAVYALNDVVDAGNDRKHPVKKTRPIAAGDISRPAGSIIAVILAAGALLMSFFYLGWKFGACALGYLVINVGYSFILKNVVIVDCIAIALGFVIRAVAGIYAIITGPVHISEWLLICTFFLALFLGFSKRRGEITDLTDGAVAYRPILAAYSPKLIDEMIAVATASTVMSYSLYSIWPGTVERLGTGNMFFTIPFVVYGVFRYLYLIHREGKGASPTSILLRDRPLQLDIILYVAAVFVILYWLK